jgi:Ca2+-binding RTX toxin-like protein
MTIKLLRLPMLLLVAPLAALLPTTAAHAVSTCHGEPATIEGSAGPVTGTPGNDVIVVTGKVTTVAAGDGDDLVCVVDNRKLGGPKKWLEIDAGYGDDEIDASAARAKTRAYLPAGADSYLGSDLNDEVTLGIDPSSVWTFTRDAGPFHVLTGDGKDELRMAVGAVVDADLGRGADDLVFQPSLSSESVYAGPDSTFDLGAGLDRAFFQDWWESPGGNYQTALVVDVPRERLTWWGVESTLRGVEGVFGAARRAVLRGTARDNTFSVDGCNVLLKGAGGDDRLYSSNYAGEDGPSCHLAGSIRHHLYGGTGDDYLVGTAGHDVFIGGPGYDLADGSRGGHDRCEVERSWGKGCTE